MDTFNPNQMPNINNSQEKKSIGPLIAVIIILALIVVGGLYFLNERSSNRYVAPEINQGEDPVVESLEIQNGSDELESIEADLEATNLSGLDSEDMEAEIQAELSI